VPFMAKNTGPGEATYEVAMCFESITQNICK